MLMMCYVIKTKLHPHSGTRPFKIESPPLSVPFPCDVSMYQHITGSSFFVDTETTDTEASASTAEGVGLSGGVAGESLSFVVQANDKRKQEVQALVAWAEVGRV